MKRPDEPREKVVGSDKGPEKPFPLRISGEVISGFGRGSKEVSSVSISFVVDGGWPSEPGRWRHGRV